MTAIAIQPNGQVIAGGYFTSVETTVSTTLTVRNQIARFNADGTLDANFAPVLNGTPFVITLRFPAGRSCSAAPSTPSRTPDPAPSLP